MSTTEKEPPQQLFRYTGPGEGHGSHHYQLYSPYKAGGPVFTWSLPSRNPQDGGWSWMGSREEFEQQFEPA